MAPKGRVGGRIALKRFKGLGHPILKEGEAGVVQKKVIRHLGKVQKASGRAYRDAKTLYRQTSDLSSTGTLVAEYVAQKLKEDYEASPT